MSTPPPPPGPIPNLIPPWLLVRFRKMLDRVPRIHFEASMYGPTTALLVSIFPPQERFIVKPQAPLRPSHQSRSSSVIGLHPGSPRDSDLGSDVMSDIQVPDEDDFSEAQFSSWRSRTPITPPRPAQTIANVWQHLNDADDRKSVDSYNDNVVSRNTHQSNKGVGFIDFVCVKATEELDQDIVLSALELKRDDLDLATRELQFRDYLEILETKSIASDFKGFLVKGNKTQFYEMFEGRIVFVKEMDTMGPEMQHLLHDLAAAHRDASTQDSEVSDDNDDDDEEMEP